MNGKKFAALAFAASLAATTLPSFAATGTVTVKWNTQAIANITLYTQASAAQTHSTSAQAMYQGFSAVGTAAGCNGSTSGTAGATTGDTEATTGTVNFGNVTPDSAASVFCLETNAVNAYVTTNDTNGYVVTEQMTGGTPTGYGAAGGENVCLYANGTYANNLAWATSGRSAAVTTATATTCPASSGTGYVASATAPVTLLTVAGASTTGTSLPADMELFVPANAATNAVSATLTYTLTPS